MVHVDDLPIFVKDKNTFSKVTHLYDVENLGPTTHFLGIKFNYTNEYVMMECK